ncbi:kinesin-like protein KIN-7M, chloroplastic [Actinia tenebrosa]|uniref:Kinesin-like protein KIN-7M, chloroplastic n=1 Tax=Actinia tenebrosa TaxID=6105 RepID=A0A6P8IQP9_ACTTE|nr:kinesin-like protein KIN-7M, chloroplastic [Actinia tenebrosa]
MSIQGRKIQAKKSKNDLESTADKVRLIKERQSQWFKEREEAKGSKALGSAKSTESIRERSKRSSVRSSPIPDLDIDTSSNRSSASKSSGRDVNPYSNPRRKPLYTAPIRDHSNIVSWSNKGDNVVGIKRPPSGQSKKNPLSKTALDSTRSNYSNTGGLREKTYEPSNYNSSAKNLDDSVRDAFSHSTYSKLEPVSRDYPSKSFENGRRIDPDVDDKRDTSCEFSNQNVNISELKAVNEKKGGTRSGLDQDMIDALAETVAQRLKTTIRGKEKDSHGQNSNGEDDEEMSTHLCPVCNSLMSGSRHTPMALIPCGHTLCQVCLRDCKKCPTCQSRISSSAVNTVLQQIIAGFIAQKEKKRLEKMEIETRKYVDEYQSLSVRSNALAEEADAILNGMEDLTEQLFQEKKMYKKIQVDNEDLTKKIQELQKQLEKNQIKMTESKEACENLESQYEEEKQRLALVEDTVKTIRQSKERVKMLVHNFAPSLNLEQFD